MKTAILFLLPIAVLLSCKEPQKDVTPTNPSSGSQTPPVVERVVKLGPVVQITGYSVDPNGDKTFILNGSQLKVGWTRLTNYEYDDQNRLAGERSTASYDRNWWEGYSYQYAPDLNTRYQNSENKEFLNTLFLNEQGYLKGNSGPGEYIYNADGYLISYNGNGQQDTYTIENGNIVAKKTVYRTGGVQYNTYEYDLTKPGIPSPFTYRGKPSQNLLIKQTLVSTDMGSPGYSQTTVFTYYHHFDPQNRPIREFLVTDTDPVPRSIREFVYK